jgi:hypothetical protein
MTFDTDYVLGTHDEEIARLGIQHQVWRSNARCLGQRRNDPRIRSRRFWRRTGYATCDAAEIVGPQGQATAIERSPHFLEFAVREMERRNMFWIRFAESDLMAGGLSLTGFDLAW